MLSKERLAENLNLQREFSIAREISKLKHNHIVKFIGARYEPEPQLPRGSGMESSTNARRKKWKHWGIHLLVSLSTLLCARGEERGSLSLKLVCSALG